MLFLSRCISSDRSLGVLWSPDSFFGYVTDSNNHETAAGKRKKSLTASFKTRHECGGETRKLYRQLSFRQEDSGGNSRKPLTNHSIMVIYLQGWATDSSELALTLFPFLFHLFHLILSPFSLPASILVLGELLPVQNSKTDQCLIPKSREKVIHLSLWDSMVLSLLSLSNALPLHHLQRNKSLSMLHSLIKMKISFFPHSLPLFCDLFGYVHDIGRRSVKTDLMDRVYSTPPCSGSSRYGPSDWQL